MLRLDVSDLDLAQNRAGTVCQGGTVTTLPRAVRVAKVDREPAVRAQPHVLRHLRALIPGQRAAQLHGQAADLGGGSVKINWPQGVRPVFSGPT